MPKPISHQVQFLIDTHCHSTSKPFMSVSAVNRHLPHTNRDFNINSDLLNLLSSFISRASQVLLRYQSNFDDLYLGGTRVAFVSLTPAEKGFLLLNQKDLGALENLRGLLCRSGPSNEKLLSPNLVNALTGFSVGEIKTLQSVLNNYYSECFVPEFRYLTHSTIKNAPRTINGVTYKVRFPRNYSELETFLQDDRNLSVIINIEGAHVFDKMPMRNDLAAAHTSPPNIDIDINNPQQTTTIANNIKDFVDKHAATAPIFSVGLLHHFWNGLGGHARSLQKLVGTLVNQEEGLNLGLTRTGKETLVEITRANRLNAVVDIKHMSPQCRKDFYAFRKSNATIARKPIMCSHTGINMSFSSLDEWINYVRINSKEIGGRRFDDGLYYLHENSINLCRTDLLEIFNSKGLIGLQLDSKRIMGPLAVRELERRTHPGESRDESNYVYAKIICANFFAAIDELRLGGVPSSRLQEAWDIFSIGSDFDGIINHLKNCPSARSLGALKAQVDAYLQMPEDIKLYDSPTHEAVLTVAEQLAMMGNYTSTELANKIFGGNALEFLSRTF
jgi:hypothetical protein